jgi:hypothetical protein
MPQHSVKNLLLKGWLLEGQSHFLQLKNIGKKNFECKKVLCKIDRISFQIRQ